MRPVLLFLLLASLSACAPATSTTIAETAPMHAAPAPGEISGDWMRVRQTVISREVTYHRAPDRPEQVARSVVSSRRKMSIDVREAPVADVLARVARVANLKLVTEDVRGTITLAVKDAPVRRVFEQIVAARGLKVVRIGEVILVSDAS